MRAALLTVLACLSFAAVEGKERNAYLIASEPYGVSSYGFPTLLYRVDGGRLVKVRTVTTQQQNTRFVDVYPDKGYALVGSDIGKGRGSLLLDVIDMNSVSTQKSYEIDTCEGCGALRAYLRSRDSVLVYVLRTFDETFIYRGVDLKTGRIFADFIYGDEAWAYRTGTGSGFVDRFHWHGMQIEEGHMLAGIGLEKRRLSWVTPTGLEWDLGPTDVYLLVNNNDVRVISARRFIADRNRADWDFQDLGKFAFDKTSGAWSKLDLPGKKTSLRAFDHWLVSEEIHDYEPGALDLARLDRQWFPPFLSAAVNLSLVREIAPAGRLRFYNVRNKALVVHDTGEPNSEVLYVDEDDVAWYRVSDELRRAPIEDGRLGQAELVAKAPELWAVHWLFFGRE